MAVDWRTQQRDMYTGVSLRDVDVRIALGPWVYYVRAVKCRWEVGHPMPPSSGSILGDLTVGLALDWAYERWGRRRPWWLAVVRLPDVASWNPQGPTTVHLECLHLDADLDRAIDDLVARVRSGEFEPTPPR